jgi:hypothetical protein
MIITYRDELGLVSLESVVCISFDGENAYFTDTDGKDYKVSVEYLVSITDAE